MVTSTTCAGSHRRLRLTCAAMPHWPLLLWSSGSCSRSAKRWPSTQSLGCWWCVAAPTARGSRWTSRSGRSATRPSRPPTWWRQWARRRVRRSTSQSCTGHPTSSSAMRAKPTSRHWRRTWAQCAPMSWRRPRQTPRQVWTSFRDSSRHPPGSPRTLSQARRTLPWRRSGRSAWERPRWMRGRSQLVVATCRSRWWAAACSSPALVSST
mmetsp:Transcript_89731/g.231652  ORF Transcript_89731/g.231652 Transcript_89731/m.231652 type:complete len:209 (-) Transcript_89731:218-844(-)